MFTCTTEDLIEKDSLLPRQFWFVNQSNIYFTLHKWQLKNFQDYLGNKSCIVQVKVET